MVDKPSFAEKLEFAIESQFNVRLHIHRLLDQNAYEILFKHVGDTTWHEFILPDTWDYGSDPRLHFNALYTHIRVTKP
jgi:hypothetical protein